VVHQVYENWSDGEVSRGATFTDGVANVLAPSSFCPLGEPCGEHGEYVRVMHPAFLNERSGALTTCDSAVMAGAYGDAAAFARNDTLVCYPIAPNGAMPPSLAASASADDFGYYGTVIDSDPEVCLHSKRKEN